MEIFHYKVGFNQHNSQNDGVMYNITNILTPFCQVYLRLYPYYTGTFIRLYPYFLI